MHADSAFVVDNSAGAILALGYHLGFFHVLYGSCERDWKWSRLKIEVSDGRGGDGGFSE